jgi:single-strand DNA-binding protein
MNVLNAIGGIGKDCVIRYTSGGDAIADFSFALTSGYGDKQVTTWLNCSLFGKRAETLAPMLLKGTRIGITGELCNRPYKDKQGNDKHSLEVRISDVTLLGKKDLSTGSASQSSARQNEQDFDDSIPF